MPFNCDVCGDEVGYEERVFKLKNNAEIVICKKCLRKPKKKGCIEQIQDLHSSFEG